jgi:hypothetical protein
MPGACSCPSQFAFISADAAVKRQSLHIESTTPSLLCLWRNVGWAPHPLDARRTAPAPRNQPRRLTRHPSRRRPPLRQFLLSAHPNPSHRALLGRGGKSWFPEGAHGPLCETSKTATGPPGNSGGWDTPGSVLGGVGLLPKLFSGAGLRGGIRRIRDGQASRPEPYTAFRKNRMAERIFENAFVRACFAKSGSPPPCRPLKSRKWNWHPPARVHSLRNTCSRPRMLPCWLKRCR